MLRERNLGDENGDDVGEIGEIVDERVSRIIRIERTIFSWMTARQSIRSSRKAVGVYSRWNCLSVVDLPDSLCPRRSNLTMRFFFRAWRSALMDASIAKLIRLASSS